MAVKELLEKVNFKYVLVALSTAVLVYIAVQYYKHNVLKKLQPDYAENQEFVFDEASKSGKDKDIKMYFFTVDWCPYCKVASPIWNDFSDKNKDNFVNGKRVVFKKINCSALDSGTQPNNADDERCVNLPPEEYDLINDSENPVVTGYPTVLIIDGHYEKNKRNNIFVLESKITNDSLKKFLHKSTKYKST